MAGRPAFSARGLPSAMTDRRGASPQGKGAAPPEEGNGGDRNNSCSPGELEGRATSPVGFSLGGGGSAETVEQEAEGASYGGYDSKRSDFEGDDGPYLVGSPRTTRTVRQNRRCSRCPVSQGA